MRGVVLLGSLLLATGLGNGLPQYGPGNGVVGPVDVAAKSCTPYTHDCVPYYQCIDGVINTSGAGLIDVRIRPLTECTSPEYPGVPGICCRIPGATTPTTPAPLQACSKGRVCVEQGQCNSDGTINTDGSGLIDPRIYSRCYIDPIYDLVGVCCLPPLPTATTCGVRNYGFDVRTQVKLQKAEAQFGEFPWQAVLFYSNFTFKCGASLVETRWLITGAHCVAGYQHGDFKVRLGEWQVDRYDEPLNYIDVDIAAIYVHPNFVASNLHNDIAILKLAVAVVPQYHINTVCIPRPGQLPSEGTRCFATGWGKDAFDGAYQARLKKVDVPYVEHSSCQHLLRRTRLGKYFKLDQSFLCAGGEENRDACTGDGGGPLVCVDPASGAYFLQGITAWGIDCGQPDVPGVYVDVQFFRDFIDEIIYGGSNPYGRK